MALNKPANQEKNPVGRPRTDSEEVLQHRYRKIDVTEARKMIDREIELRFVEEVELLEREGRVQSRAILEKDLKMQYNRITQIKYGANALHLANLQLLKTKYNGDLLYILLGVRDPHGTSGPMRGGKKLNIWPPYDYQYKTWKQKAKEPELSESKG